MNPLLDTSRVLLFVLLLARTSAFVASAPFFGENIVPMKVRALLAGALAVCLAAIAPPIEALPATLVDLVILAGGEALVGLAIGFLARLFVLAFEMAGEIVGIQMGFGIAAVLDPLGGHRASLIGRVFWLAGMMLFFTLGGHHLLLRGLAGSLAACPPGHPLPVDGAAAFLAKTSGEALAAPLKIGAPVVGILLLATMGLGILARTVPQMNVFVVGFPVKIAVGLAAIALSLPFFVEVARGELSRLAVRIATLLPVS